VCTLLIVGRFSQNFAPISRSRVFTKMRAQKKNREKTFVFIVCVEAGRLLVFDLRRSLAH
jgi:hypothetical protein